MLIVLTTTLLLTVFYVVLMFLYTRGWRLQKDFVVPEDFSPATRISVIIPARNEEHNIGACIQSILSNQYPDELFEIIVIDDHSSDSTFEIVNSFKQENVRCLKLSDFLKEGERINAYKKKGIETGIANTKGDLIITTDADCIVSKNWLKNIAAIYQQENPVMIVGPVVFSSNGSMLEIFQSIDFITMQGITAAAHRLGLGNMSNGANLAFRTSAFSEVKGYEGVDHLATGDDYLLMMKMQKKFPGRITYLKSRDAIVHTAPQTDWKSFLQQRIRWASKSGKYDDTKLNAVLALVYLFNLSFLFLLVAGFKEQWLWLLGVGILFVKTTAELIFLLPVSEFFKKRKELPWFPMLQPLHILYIIAAGFLGLIGVYQWKGRKVK